MNQIKCQKCGKIINNVPDNWDRNFKCNNCGGYFTEIDNNSNPYSITDQFRSMGTDIRNNMPRIVIGKTEPVQNSPQNQKTSLPRSSNQQIRPIEEPLELKQRRLLAKAEFWIFAVVMILVLGFAAWRLLNIFF